jgi:hypothetical protein
MQLRTWRSTAICHTVDFPFRGTEVLLHTGLHMLVRDYGECTNVVQKCGDKSGTVCPLKIFFIGKRTAL